MASHLDSNKPRMELLPAAALTEWARAMTFGATKYGDHNWRKGMAWTRVLGSLSRHLTSFMAGEDRDPESGVNHMAHVMCNAAFLLHYEKHHPELDDRYRADPGPVLDAGLEASGSTESTESTQWGGFYIGPQEQFLYTFDSAEFSDAQLPDHWVQQYFPETPLYLFASGEELAAVLRIYSPA